MKANEAHHGIELSQILLQMCGDSEEDIKAWIVERKARFSTRNRIQEKQQFHSWQQTTETVSLFWHAIKLSTGEKIAASLS